LKPGGTRKSSSYCLQLTCCARQRWWNRDTYMEPEPEIAIDEIVKDKECDESEREEHKPNPMRCFAAAIV
jgi:hypothetical protein